MTWAKMDDKRATHWKLRQAGFAARGLDEAAIEQIAGDETDGYISAATVEWLASAHRCDDWKELVDRLVDATRWTPTDGGWIVNGYLDYNPSHAELEAERAAKREAGRKGGLRSGRTRSLKAARSKAEAPASILLQNGASVEKSEDNPVDKGEAGASFLVEPPSRPVPSRKSSTSSVTETQRAQNADDDDIREQAIDVLARRDLQRKIDDTGKTPGNEEGWLRAVRDGRRTRHRDQLDQLDLAQFTDPETLARWLDPNAWPKPDEPPLVHPARYDTQPDCDECGGGGRILTDTDTGVTSQPCPTCQPRLRAVR